MADELGSVAEQLRSISERLATINHGSAALMRRSVEQALSYAPASVPPEQVAAPQQLGGQPSGATSEQLSELVRREVLKALQSIQSGQGTGG